ncbi:MAG: hypothetical protein QGH74_02090 [Candidatus Brocadiia bacterium]|jgi:hypothetical protein|nr:hypothetical protein [Candidatus Brocadiia bacterium]
MKRQTKKIVRRDPIFIVIDRIRRTARRWALEAGYAAVLLMAVALVFGGVLGDHALALQRTGRAAFFYGFVAAVAVGLAAATLVPMLARLSVLFVAREIERAVPELKNSLISYVQCRRDTPAKVRNLLRRRAYPLVRSVDAHLLARRVLAVRLSWAVVAAVLVFTLYGVLSPKSAVASVARLFAPAADILAPTRTRIVEVEPGDVTMLRGRPLAVRARIGGLRARRVTPERVALLWDGRTFSDRTVVLSEGKDGWWGAELPAVLEGGAYRVVAGDARSESYRIDVIPRPAVTAVQCRLIPPAYTGLPMRTIDDGNLDVPAGTRVELTATTSLPARVGYLEMASGRRIWMKSLAPSSALSAEFEATRSDSCQILFETIRYDRTPDPLVFSFRNEAPVTYRIVCRADGAPEARILEPANVLRVEPGAILEVTYEAGDDYGLAALALRYKVDGGRGGRIPLPVEAGACKAEGSLRWELEGLNLRAGNVVEYHVEATDNWPDGPHVGASMPPHRLLVGPGEPDGVAQAGDQGLPSGEAPEAQKPAPGEGERDGAAGDRDGPDGKTMESPEEGLDKVAGKGKSSLAERIARAYQRKYPSDSGEGEGAPGGEKGEGASGGEKGEGATGGEKGEGAPGGEKGEGATGGDSAGGRTGLGASYDSVTGTAAQDEGGAHGRADEGESALSEAELKGLLEAVQRRLDDGSLPEEILGDLAMSREELKQILAEQLELLAERRPAEGDSSEAPPARRSDPAGRVLGPGSGADEDVSVQDAAGKADKDELKSRFEDGSGRISPRYREAVNAYYERLSRGE